MSKIFKYFHVIDVDHDEPDLTQLLLTTLLSLKALTGQSMGSCLGNTKNESVGLFCHSLATNQTPHVKVFCLLKFYNCVILVLFSRESDSRLSIICWSICLSVCNGISIKSHQSTLIIDQLQSSIKFNHLSSLPL